ncbi:MAG: hypothetical protein GDA56_05645 [Hormoscilla sp. GM7CHS1pb]|nr:hypothetical protein [Hormoscilla sp. GM7CHS1pb]
MLENDNTKPKAKVFSNNEVGFDRLITGLKKYQVTQIHACMEATSIYGEALADRAAWRQPYFCMKLVIS